MKQIKFFTTVLEDKLERDVNDYLKELSRGLKEVVDIRCNTYVSEHGHDQWTVMIIYED